MKPLKDKIYKFSLFLIFIVNCNLNINGEDLNQSNYKGCELRKDHFEKKLPVYRFKHNKIGRFLEMFCDSCSNIDHSQITVLGKANSGLVKYVLNEKQENYNDYVVIYTTDKDRLVLRKALGIIKPTNGPECILTNLTKATIGKLQLVEDKDDSASFCAPDDYTNREAGFIAIFYIPSDTKCELVSILINDIPIQEIDTDVESLRWFRSLLP